MTTATAPAPTAIDPRTSLTFARRERSTTHWIEGEYPADARPQALFDAFAAAGWQVDPVTESIPAYEPVDFDFDQPVGQQVIPRGYKVREFALTKPGTDLFTDWTQQEKAANMRQARGLLRRFGFTRVPVWTKTLADML